MFIHHSLLLRFCRINIHYFRTSPSLQVTLISSNQYQVCSLSPGPLTSPPRLLRVSESFRIFGYHYLMVQGPVNIMMGRLLVRLIKDRLTNYKTVIVSKDTYIVFYSKRQSKDKKTI